MEGVYIMAEKKFPTEEMLAARERLNKIPKEERLKRLKASLWRKRGLFGETICIPIEIEEDWKERKQLGFRKEIVDREKAGSIEENGQNDRELTLEAVKRIIEEKKKSYMENSIYSDK